MCFIWGKTTQNRVFLCFITCFTRKKSLKVLFAFLFNPLIKTRFLVQVSNSFKYLSTDFYFLCLLEKTSQSD